MTQWSEVLSPGTNLWVAAPLLGFAAAALWTDARSWRIPNKLNALGVLAGILLHAALDGWSGVGFAAAGLAVGFAATLVLYLCRAVGAGDVKCFAALGALGGWQLALYALMYAVVFGGAIGLGIVVGRRMFGLLATRMRTAMITALLLRIWPFPGRGGQSGGEKLTRFPFMYAVFPAVAAAVWLPAG